MAINTQKFLSGSKGTAKPLPQAKISSITLTSQDKKNVNTIRVKTIQIDKMLKGTLAADKKRLDDKKREASKKRKDDIETKLEKKPDPKKKFKMPNILPRMGVLDWIKNFIGNVLLGYFAVRLLDKTSLLSKVFVGIVAVGEFIIDWGGKLLNAVVTFIDWGYKIYDGFRGQVGKIFGDDGLKKFDSFMGALKNVLNAAIIVALSVARMAPSLLKGKGGKGGLLKGKGGKPKVTTSGGFRNPLRGKPKVTTSGGFRNPLRGRPNVTGTFGKRAAARILGPIVKRIPIIGGLLEFAISWATGDPIGKAAFRGIGAGLGTWIGGALGTLIPVPGVGTAIGMFLGGMGGAELGGVMYDAFFGGKKSPPKKGYAKGGRVKKATRAVKPRGVVASKKKRPIKNIDPVKIDPGEDISDKTDTGGFGGWIQNIFGSVVDTFSPLKFFKVYGDKFGAVPFFGPIISLAVQALVGQKPGDKEYKNAGMGIISLLAKGLNMGKLVGSIGGVGFAGGGLVDRVILKKESKVADWLGEELKKSITPIVDETISEIEKNLGKKKEASDQPGSQYGSGPQGYMTGPAGTSGDKLTMARNLMRDLGLTEAQAAGIVGNMAAESGVENGRPQGSSPGVKAPLVVDGKTGYGLVQWTSQGRQQRLWDFAKSKGHDMSKPLTMDIEYQFFLKEFQGRYGPVLDQIREAKNVKDASTIFMQQYEIPAGYRTQAKIMERYNMSQPIYKNLSSGQGTATEGVGQFIPSKDDGQSSQSYNIGGSGIVDIGKSLAKEGFAVAEHPDFTKFQGYTPGKGSVSNVHSGKGHYEGRALDVTDHRGSMADSKERYRSVLDNLYANRKNNNLKMLIHDSWGDWYSPNTSKSGPGGYGHPTHMHIETYHKGGEVPGKGERWAKLLGEEIVIDVDSAGPAKDMLLAINQASGRDGVMKAIRDYAPYEAIQSRMIPVPVDRMVPVPIPSKSGGGTVVIGGGGGNDPFSSLALNG